MALFNDTTNYNLDYKFIKDFLSSAKTPDELELYYKKAKEISYTNDNWSISAINYFYNNLLQSMNSVINKSNLSTSNNYNNVSTNLIKNRLVTTSCNK